MCLNESGMILRTKTFYGCPSFRFMIELHTGRIDAYKQQKPSLQPEHCIWLNVCCTITAPTFFPDNLIGVLKTN